MNDLYLTNGKTGHYRNLGLPTTQKVQAEWPTPSQIKLNAKKREIVTIASRIDEVAFTMLNLFAEQCDMTTSAFVNELINSYINQHQHSVDGEVFKSTINLCLDRFSAKIEKMSVDQAILTYHADSLRYAIESATGKKLDKKDTSFCALDTLREIVDRRLEYYLYKSFLGCFMSMTNENKAIFTDNRDVPLEEKISEGLSDFSVVIPCAKWVYVTPILEYFDTKCEQYLNSYEYKDLCQNEAFYQKIVKTIDAYDGPELAEKLTDTLKFKGGEWFKILQK